MATKSAGARSAGTSDLRWKPEWDTGEDGYHRDRYISQDFADLEAEKLWPHAWQMACRIEEIPRPGDYTVYEIIDQSILIIRTDENTIKAYHNVCPHRATALAVGTGRFSTGEITCPFHGWRWNLEGDNTFVLDRDEFKGGCLSDEDVKLKECQVATWIGCVFINMDADAKPFDEHVAPIKEFIDPLMIDQMQFYWWKSVVVPCNWKVAQEAFHEGYHVPGTHPQIYDKDSGPEAYTKTHDYRTFDNGHGIFNLNTTTNEIGGSSVGNAPSQEDEVEALIHNIHAMWDQMDAMMLKEEVDVARSMRHRKIPEGSSVGEEYMKAILEFYGNQGRPIADPAIAARVTDCFVYPNYTFLPAYGNILIYRSRPLANNDPDWCQFELWSCRTYPEGQKPPRPQVEICTDVGDPAQYRLIPRQDFSNVPRIQKGLHSHGFERTMLSGRQEIFLTNMHSELDKYLKA